MADLKVLRPELAAALGPERFLREIELSARLTHPHVLPLYDSGEAEGSLLRHAVRGRGVAPRSTGP
jgi:serine/threonine protein kinase